MPSNYVCSDAAAGRGEGLYATGSRVAAWLLIEVSGAWGTDAVHESALGRFVPADWKDQLRGRRIRAICIRSRHPYTADGVRLFTSVAPRPAGPAATLWARRVESLAAVVGVADELDINDPNPAEWQPVERAIFLVCTNGRHDQCCANLGRPLVRALERSPWAERVWECSHIGGDRFAANVVALPHSVYFGRVDPESAPAVLGALDEGRLDLGHFRGRTSYSLAQQAVEHFVRTSLGVDGWDAVVIGQRSDDGSFPVRVDERGLTVRIQRRMVSVAEPLTCRGTAGQLVPAFTLVSITPSITTR